MTLPFLFHLNDGLDDPIPVFGGEGKSLSSLFHGKMMGDDPADVGFVSLDPFNGGRDTFVLPANILNTDFFPAQPVYIKRNILKRQSISTHMRNSPI